MVPGKRPGPGGADRPAGDGVLHNTAFFEALYISLVTLATLGFGDVVPTHAWLRFFVPVEALTGFALLTTALTWFSQIYPPLTRRRSLALELRSLAEVRYADVLTEDTVAAVRLLDTLTAAVVKVGLDLLQHSETYYFQEENPDQSLARHLPYALELRARAERAPAPQLSLSARRLGVALEQLSQSLRVHFLRTGGTPREVFAAYLEDHGRKARA